MTSPPQGWYPDPHRQANLRYWDGRQWTNQTTSPSAATASAAASTPLSANEEEVSFLGAKKKAQQLLRENLELRGQIEQMRKTLAEQTLLLNRVHALTLTDVEAQIAQVRAQIAGLLRQKAQLEAEISAERQQLVEVQGRLQMQDVGLYEYHHPAETSVKLRVELDRVQSRIKETIRTKAAIHASTNFFFNNSATQGRKFVNEMSRIMLRAYNSEAENCVKTVKAGNLLTAVGRLTKAKEQIEKQGQMISLRVSDDYHYLRVQELELAADFQMRLQEEKEAERERKAELREQRKAEQELRAERERLEKQLAKEQAHYMNVKAMLEDRGDVDAIRRIEERLADVQRAIDDVDYRTANIRAGFVYVISNLGSFGPNMVKIGLTRRLEPLDRVRELGDASVPFRFDIHALFFSDDAVTVETKLHQAFAEKRVNRVNLRREFFGPRPTRCSPS
ncbi:DUF4041 domain-containing protein (plasmid) [Mycolicibacterium aichiense]|uniref:DUF4041 domain-containing protein n=1 Tax=Mycolicibacterium aichiense TaxID=1799 RepID=UPI003D674421